MIRIIKKIIVPSLILVCACALFACKENYDKETPEPRSVDQTPPLQGPTPAEGPAEPQGQTPPSMGVGITPKTSQGQATIVPISSDSRCRANDDCSHTRLANVPRSSSDCQCGAGCTPYVVNKDEENARQDAYIKFCKLADVLGPQCGAPTCRFIEFDTFKCEQGKCVGYALGMK